MIISDLNIILIAISCFLFGFLISLIVLRGWARKISKAKLDKEKTAFIAVASHYLLTPLSIIEGTISHIQEKESILTLQEREEQHQILKESADRLLLIAEQMLLLTRVENGELKVNSTVQSLYTIVHEVVIKEDKNAKRRNIYIRFIADPNNRFEGRFDHDSLRAAIRAVVENAVKFSHDDSQVMVLLAEKDKNYILEVRDQGIGMTAEQLMMAKEKFYRGTPPYQFDYEGIGLGLYAADIVMKAHQGKLIIQSSGEDLGTIVQLVFER